MENTSHKYWEQKISEWSSSGLNIRDWCEESQTDIKQFYKWKNKLENNGVETQETVFAEVTSHFQARRPPHRISVIIPRDQRMRRSAFGAWNF